MRFFFTIFLFLIINTGFAQKNESRFIGANLHVGKVINNYTSLDSFPKTNPSAIIELSIGKQTTGTRSWQKNYGFPQVGVSVIGGSIGNNKQFGMLLGAAPYITLNTVNNEKWSVKIKLGLGLAYFNKPYDSLENPYNILIGSNLTALGVANLYVQRSLSESLNFEFGLSVFHASNGHTGLPNVGLNMINISTGLKYYLNGQNFKFSNNSDFEANKRLFHVIRIGVGTHKFGNELGPVNSPSYLVYDAAFYIGKPVGKLGSGLVGLGYKYYTSYYQKIIEGDIYSENQNLKSMVLTVFLAYEFEIGQMSLLAQGGINVYNPFWEDFVRLIGDTMTFYKKVEGVISTRLGLQYYLFDREKFKKNIYIGAYIKANLGGADFVSVTTGFKF